MKQLLYIVAFIALIFITQKVMSRVKPTEETEEKNNDKETMIEEEEDQKKEA